MTGAAPHLEVRRVDHHDEEWIRERMRTRWGGETVAGHGRLYDPAALPGFVVVADLIEPVGLITYSLESGQCEVVTIDSMREGCGVGSLLIDAVIHLARDVRSERVWLVTTNDNVHAQAWYERRGFRRAAVHPGAVAASRTLKPSIPMIGHGGVPITDEIEYEYPIL
jgi:N-acetylglutamate synthase-like GNAT family acetyltransferase